MSPGGPPELGVAVVVDGRTLEIRRFVERMVRRTTRGGLPSGVRIEVTAGTLEPEATTEVVPVVETQSTKLDAGQVVAQRIDGRAVSFKALMDELARPTPVIPLLRGQQVDPVFSKMFKADSLVLQLQTSLTVPTTVLPGSSAPGGRPQ